MLIGLGEIHRATTVLLGLWEKSQCSDFEVFALLSSLYFQLGRWRALEKLIEGSLSTFFSAHRTEGKTEATTATTAPIKEEEVDEFDFDETEKKAEEKESGKEEVNRLYGDTVTLDTEEKKRSFITLVNVHAELLNEQGKHMECVRLMEFAAAMLNVTVPELPPDLIVRLTTAYAFIGDRYIEPCKELVRHIYEHCPMNLYSDVIYDVAVVLRKVALFEEGSMLFEMFARYNEFVYNRQLAAFRREEETLQTMESDLRKRTGEEKSGAVLPSAELIRQQKKVQEQRQELNDLSTIVAAAYEGYAYCSFLNTGEVDSAVTLLRRALELEPTQVAARLLLGQLLFFNKKDFTGAVAVLTPQPAEPPLQRVQVGLLLTRILYCAEQYVEAIALGVSIFELILNSPDDGDTMSTAPGAKRSRTQLTTPSITRASSAIVSAGSLSARIGGATSSVGSLAHSVASSIRAGTSVYRQQLHRRGSASLTTTVYGASAAASVSAGTTEKEKIKDQTAIFNFNGRYRRKRADRINDEETKVKSEEETNRPELTTLDAKEFWTVQPKGEEEGALSEEDVQAESPVNDTPTDRKPRKRVRLEVEDAPPVLRSGDSTAGDKDRDLEELERFEREMAEVGPEQQEREDPYALPSLEEVSATFKDPEMARMFLEVSTNEAPLATSSVTPVAEAPLPPPNVDHVSVKEVLRAVGRTDLMDLAAIVVSSYSALQQFNEAKEFAVVALRSFSRKKRFASMSDATGRPLRVALLRAAIASEEVEDAFRVATRLLEEDSTPAQRREVMDLLHVICYRRKSSYFLIKNTENPEELPIDLLSLVASRYWSIDAYVQALSVYRIIFKQKPNDVRLHFILALGYLFSSHRKGGEAKLEGAISTALLYLDRYQALTTRCSPARTGEALYNTARAMQLLGLYYLAIPLYERIVHDLTVPQQCAPAVRTAAQFNLYHIYRWTSSNRTLALRQLPSLQYSDTG
ncbi:hypothetical protein AGDE_13881 [Angomonas deanei]|uniref:Tetratricopeptide repeat, putative n=1 Tax=Angomonas deanei TaxID=59799 RepID=A0A7G2CII2_9TRYP|nr:hypothetical protein AGDE_13881 [Angomonas deanei]CAD2219229.1 Tetratricopeptide repeat, putative [Angomonas deanei]|eukprot:EPY21669.1 hypothetical protein AGDE_13881 [Angomonas deanei]